MNFVELYIVVENERNLCSDYAHTSGDWMG